MNIRRKALIGHSGAGKSSCLIALDICRQAADMDIALGTQASPKLKDALDWLAKKPPIPSVVVVSNHEQMLEEMKRAKLAEEEYSEQFAAVRFVYLWKPKDQLKAHLCLPTAGKRFREVKSQRYTLENYNRFDALFASLANDTINCSGLSVEEVAAKVANLT